MLPVYGLRVVRSIFLQVCPAFCKSARYLCVIITLILCFCYYTAFVYLHTEAFVANLGYTWRDSHWDFLFSVLECTYLALRFYHLPSRCRCTSEESSCICEELKEMIHLNLMIRHYVCCRYFSTVAIAAWYTRRYELAVFTTAISSLLGWPFAALLG